LFFSVWKHPQGRGGTREPPERNRCYRCYQLLMRVWPGEKGAKDSVAIKGKEYEERRGESINISQHRSRAMTEPLTIDEVGGQSTLGGQGAFLHDGQHLVSIRETPERKKDDARCETRDDAASR